MMEVIEIEFKGRRRGLYANPSNIALKIGDYAIVEAERGEHFGKVIRINENADPAPDLPAVLRPSTDEDCDRVARNRLKEQDALRVAREKVLERDLVMKLVDVEYQFDENKISFFFTADQRIDFRELVRCLASIYKTRIDMRQIGARDEARRLCSIGSCGRPLCCGQFLDKIKAVTTDLIDNQNLSLSPTKLLGACGRLKCCLLYEEGFYEEAGKRFPRLGAHIATESGACEVIKIDVVGDAILVRYDSGNVERIPRSRLGSGGCDGQKCHRHEEESPEHEAIFVE
jgi:cell fate regulator YaaT (PSP1 superfamily)